MRAVIGLGANVGDRAANLRAAVAEMGRVMRIQKLSHVYETAPVGGPAQPAYLNAAVLVDYQGEPRSLLMALLAIEGKLGRVRSKEQRWGPRPIDLDILWIENFACESEELTVPHPALVERAFALVPLVDVMPDAIDPLTQIPYLQLALRGSAGVRKTGESLALAS